MGILIDNYNLASLIFYFIIYSFFGWILENSFSFATGRPFFKDNFLMGPFKPMYGFAPILLLIFIKPETHWLTFLILCFIIPTAVEYISGVILYGLFHQRYWDYSSQKWNIGGHICLTFSIIWIFLSLLFIKWLHPLVASLYQPLESYFIWLAPILALYFLTDLLYTIKKKLPIKKLQLKPKH